MAAEDEEYILSLPKDQLHLLEPGKLKWFCQIDGCNRYTNILDFGASPRYYWRKQFVDLSNTCLYCGAHFKLYKKNLIHKLKHKPGTGIDHVRPK